MSGSIEGATSGRQRTRRAPGFGGRTPSAMWLAGPLAVALGLAGCASTVSDRAAGESCLRSTECAAGLACVEGFCSSDLGAIGGMLPNLDGGAADAMAADGSMDGAVADASMDSSPGDSGSMDSGSMDSGPMDSGPRDSGVMDTGTPDTGPADSGVADTGPADSGPADSGVADTGPADSGPADSGIADSGAAG